MIDGTIGNLGDIPDLSGLSDETRAPSWDDGWYAGRILEQRSFTDSNGNDRVFTTEDALSQNGESRNIRLQVELTRKSDSRVLNLNTLVNYRLEDLSLETLQAVAAQQERVRSGEEKTMGNLFRSFMTLLRVGALQRIAGVRQFQRNGNGGLDLTPIYGKPAYFRIGPDKNEKFKEVKEFNDKVGAKTKVL